MHEIRKTETEIIRPKVDFTLPLQTTWSSGASFSTNEYVRPTSPTGFEYQATAGGQTGTREPKWPTTLSGTVTDGSITWTAVAFATNATDTIDAVAVAAPTGLSAGTPAIDGSVISVSIAGGTRGGCYIVSVEVTSSSGELFEDKIKVEVYET